MVKRKVEPRPTSLVTEMAPPMRCDQPLADDEAEPGAAAGAGRRWHRPG